MLVERDEKSLLALTEALKDGRVAVMACDTIYGFVGVAPDTEEAIRAIKGREETKPFLRLIADPRDAAASGARLPDSPILSLWPGPFTFVLPMAEGGTVGFRVPEDQRLRRLVEAVGSPLFSTSVNRAGRPPMDDPALIHREFGGEVALVEDSGVYAGKSPSTVVDLSSRPFRILRQGAGAVPPEYLD